MAHIIKMASVLENRYKTYKKRVVTGLIIAAVCGGVGMVLFALFMIILAIPCMMGMQAAFVFAAVMFAKARTVGSGVQGESAQARLLSLLPDDYYILQNLTVTYEDKSSEIDAVVVGPTGVFAVEAKNMGGLIEANGAERQWVQHKIGRRGTPYSNTFYSPVKQVRTHVYRLANHLRDNGFRVTVESAVYFSNPETQVRQINEDSRTPVFSAAENGGADLLAYITRFPVVLHPDRVQRIVDFLKTHR